MKEDLRIRCRETKKIKISPDELQEIKTIIQNDSGKVPVITETPYGKDVFFQGDIGSEIYLKRDSRYLIISTISLRNQRVGQGTLILNILKDYGAKKGFEGIMVECANTYESWSFCNKHNFKPDYFSDLMSKQRTSHFQGNHVLRFDGIYDELCFDPTIELPWPSSN
ncbi:hypothetical protein [Desulfosporosinus sp. FKB]|uniref:hypothetical protein n=1 Tax=Desulfosporosinus sp. FKB TaxID=1969835 RepID=UPI000B49AD38|nr:hypothetical protein [Desulfosporosinus sp. FKB]